MSDRPEEDLTEEMFLIEDPSQVYVNPPVVEDPEEDRE